MVERQRYAPPPIDHSRLCSEMLKQYPSHKETPELIKALVSEYLKLWQLTLGYSERRIVTTGCILAVQDAHQTMSRGQYFYDCLLYFHRFVGRREWAWHGHADIRGTIDTLGAYTELFHDPPSEPWNEMAQAHSLEKAKFSVVSIL